MSRDMQPLLTVTGLSKTFPGLRALDQVDFVVNSGEIVALVGQNGSGKSTLVKVLSGIYEPDPGARVIAGAAAAAEANHGASELIHVIHQDLGLVPQLNTVENLDLSRRYGVRAAMPTRPRIEVRHARELLAQFDATFRRHGSRRRADPCGADDRGDRPRAGRLGLPAGSADPR